MKLKSLRMQIRGSHERFGSLRLKNDGAYQELLYKILSKISLAFSDSCDMSHTAISMNSILM